MALMHNQNPEQVKEYIRLNALLEARYGHECVMELGATVLRWACENNTDMSAAYDYGIKLAKAKLDEPIIDDAEYNEIMQAQSLMEELR